MRAPSFWWQPEAGAAAQALLPLGLLYGWAAGRRIRKAGTHLPLPVLCVGNFVAGGAGKTPLALALGRHLIACGEQPYFLSRGYRSAAARDAPVLVDRSRHTAADVGDEPLLLAQVAPTIVGADRVAAGRLAHSLGASLLILDDGLQNPALAKDLRLVAVDGRTGVGNGHCLPAGPLRAPLAAQMALASAVVVIGPGDAGKSVATLARAAGRPVIAADLVLSAEAMARLANQKVYAFAGLGLPEKFYASLKAAGADLVDTVSFPDHHPYSGREIVALQRKAHRLGASLATTEKDFARFAHFAQTGLDPLLPLPSAIPVALEFADQGRWNAYVAKALAEAKMGANSRLVSRPLREA